MAAALVWPVLVVVRRVFAQHAHQVTLSIDQHPVETFAAEGAHPPLGVGVGPSRRMHPMALMGTDLSG